MAKFGIRKIGSSKWMCVRRTRAAWVELDRADTFDDPGTAMTAAERAGLDARVISAERVS